MALSVEYITSVQSCTRIAWHTHIHNSWPSNKNTLAHIHSTPADPSYTQAALSISVHESQPAKSLLVVSVSRCLPVRRWPLQIDSRTRTSSPAGHQTQRIVCVDNKFTVQQEHSTCSQGIKFGRLWPVVNFSICQSFVRQSLLLIYMYTVLCSCPVGVFSTTKILNLEEPLLV